MSLIVFVLISQVENILNMAAFFIIPVSLDSSEITIILIVILLAFGIRRVPELLLNIKKGVQNFKEELRD